MKLLLDTCTFLWLNVKPAQVPERIRDLCRDPDNEVYLSVVSAWEIATKQMLGRLALPEPADRYVPARREAVGAVSLDLTEEAVQQLPKLPPIHRDPFDRMLICQAIVHGLAIATTDESIRRYPVRAIW